MSTLITAVDEHQFQLDQESAEEVSLSVGGPVSELIV